MPPGGSGPGGGPRPPPAPAGRPLLPLLPLLLLLGAAEGARVSSSLSTTHHVHHFHSKHGTVPIAINRMPFLTRGGHGKWATAALRPHRPRLPRVRPGPSPSPAGSGSPVPAPPSPLPHPLCHHHPSLASPSASPGLFAPLPVSAARHLPVCPFMLSAQLSRPPFLSLPPAPSLPRTVSPAGLPPCCLIPPPLRWGCVSAPHYLLVFVPLPPLRVTGHFLSLTVPSLLRSPLRVCL